MKWYSIHLFQRDYSLETSKEYLKRHGLQKALVCRQLMEEKSHGAVSGAGSCQNLRYVKTWTMETWLRKNIIFFSTEFSESETRIFAFLIWEGDHERTELLTTKQQRITLPYHLVTFLSSSVLMSHQSSWCHCHRSDSINHILLVSTYCWGKPKTVDLNGQSSVLSQVERAGSMQTPPSTSSSPPWLWSGLEKEMSNVQAEEPRAAAI